MPRKSRYNIENKIEEDNKWLCAIYIRLSVEDGDDKEESNSISNQRQLLNDFVNRIWNYQYMIIMQMTDIQGQVLTDQNFKEC